MKRRNIFSLSVMAALAFAMLTGGTSAQQKPLKEQIVGTWTLVSWEQTRGDGSKNLASGPVPRASTRLTPTGTLA
jgi:hypothetical protein